MQLPALPSAAALRELAGGLQLPHLELPRLDTAALRERLPELSERERKAAVAAAAAFAAAAAVVSALALARRRQRRRAAAAAQQQEEPQPETLGPCGVLLDPLAAPTVAEAEPAAPAGEVTTLAALEQLPSFRVFAAPVLAVRVMHQGDRLAAIHRSVLALRELKVGAGCRAAAPPPLVGVGARRRGCFAGHKRPARPSHLVQASVAARRGPPCTPRRSTRTHPASHPVC